MTVSAYIDLNVDCDFCDNRISRTIVEVGSRVDTIFLARFHSRRHGWDVINGDDICPDCQSNKLKKAVEMEGR